MFVLLVFFGIIFIVVVLGIVGGVRKFFGGVWGVFWLLGGFIEG